MGGRKRHSGSILGHRASQPASSGSARSSTKPIRVPQLQVPPSLPFPESSSYPELPPSPYYAISGQNRSSSSLSRYSSSPSRRAPTWNQINNSSSSTALAAASLVARQRPQSMIAPSAQRNSYMRPRSTYNPVDRVDRRMSTNEFGTFRLTSSEDLSSDEFTFEEVDSEEVDPMDPLDPLSAENKEPPLPPLPVPRISLSGAVLRTRRKPPPDRLEVSGLLSAKMKSISAAERSLEGVRRSSQAALFLPEPAGVRMSPRTAVSSSFTDTDTAYDSDSDSSEDGEIPQYSDTSEQPQPHHHRHHHHHHHHHHTGNIHRMFGGGSSKKNKNDSTDSFASTGSVGSPDTLLPPGSIVESLTSPIERPLTFKKTLRDPKKEHHRKKKDASKEFNELKPWKHHSDSMVVTREERELYRSVWAANKGVYVGQISGERGPIERIHGLVVREIWRRSKLGDVVLGRIWTLLMDHRRQLFSERSGKSGETSYSAESFDDGALVEREFVVGMWLIDQCLYGRKLPRTIQRQVWRSASVADVQMPSTWHRRKSVLGIMGRS